MVAEGIALVLEPYFAVVGHVRELQQLIPTLLQLKPQVVILDIAFEGGSSLPFMKRALTELGISSKFVVLTAHESRSLMNAALNSGASGFLVKGSSGQDLRLAIEAALEGRRFISGHMANAAPLKSRDGSRHRVVIGGIGLTLRQVEILVLMHAGVAREEIARQLGISIKGIEYNVGAIKSLTGIPRLLDLLRWVEENMTDARAAIP